MMDSIHALDFLHPKCEYAWLILTFYSFFTAASKSLTMIFAFVSNITIFFYVFISANLIDFRTRGVEFCGFIPHD